MIQLSEGNCPYMFDWVTCWPTTPPNTTLVLPCVTWPFEKTIPGEFLLKFLKFTSCFSGQNVMRTCSANGSWLYNSSLEVFQAMYKHCKDSCDSVGSVDSESELISRVGIFLLASIPLRSPESAPFRWSSTVAWRRSPATSRRWSPSSSRSPSSSDFGWLPSCRICQCYLYVCSF